jgi:hypothetical protein
MNQKMLFIILITLIILIISLTGTSAYIIVSSIPDKSTYSNGDLIHITMTTNIQGLIIIPDFTSIDSNFKPEMVIIEPTGFTYNIYYTLTFSNNKASATYNILISTYSNITNSSNTATTPIILDNTGLINKTQAQQTLKFTIITSEITTNITVEEGYVKICTSTGCETLSQADYEAARQVIITQGKVTLSNLTYEQLKTEITNSVSQKVNQQIKTYIDQIIGTNKLLQDNANRMQDQLKASQEFLINQSNQTQKIIKRNTLVTAGQGVLFIILVASAFFIFYLKTNTTWLS